MGLWDPRKLSENYIFCVCARLPRTLCKFTDSFKRKWKPFKRYRDLSSSFHSKRMTFHSVSQLFFIFFPQRSWKKKKKRIKAFVWTCLVQFYWRRHLCTCPLKRVFQMSGKQLNPETKDAFFVFSFFFFFLTWVVLISIISFK